VVQDVYMTKKNFCRLFLLGCAFAVLDVTPARAADTASKSAYRVELQFRIVPQPLEPLEPLEPGQVLDGWIIEVKSLDGEILRVANAVEGQTVRFRRLPPGIYALCITGSLNRMRCESIDLYPPGDQGSFSFSREMEVPPTVLNRNDLYQVRVADLAIPKEAREEFAQSEFARLRGEDQTAVRHLQGAIKIYPSYADALNNLGIQYRRTGELEKAIGYFRKVTEINPDYYVGWANLSGCLMSQAKPEEALNAIGHAYQLRPDEPLVLSYLAKIYFSLRNYSEAKRYLQLLDRLDPVYPSYPQLYLAQIAINEGDIPEAKKCLGIFLQLHPNIPDAPYYRGALKTLENTPARDTKMAGSKVSAAQ
jgi:cytochrome c-type biogenesis protein CcmH/NrfG